MKRILKTLDVIIKEVSPEDPNLTTKNQLQYTGAHIISSKIVPRKPDANTNQVEPKLQNGSKDSKRQIDDLRGEVSIINEYTGGSDTT